MKTEMARSKILFAPCLEWNHITFTFAYFSPKVVSVSTLAWLIKYIYYCTVQILIKVVINKTKVILHPGIGDLSRF